MRPEAELQPVSRTYQYRKVMKPMLERKRRARINRCLDELKELMVTALQSEGENVSKLEKADILELTVQHLHKLRDEESGARYKAGYKACAREVTGFLATVEPESASRLLARLEDSVTILSDNPPPWRPW